MRKRNSKLTVSHLECAQEDSYFACTVVANILRAVLVRAVSLRAGNDVCLITLLDLI